MGLQEIELKREYRTFRNNIVNEFYIPLLQKANEYRRSVGFFSSTALIEISVGLVELVKNNGKIKVIASPKLEKEDIEAISAGLEERKKQKIIEKRLLDEIKEPENLFEKERLNLLANLIAQGYMDIKIAVCKRDGMYHEKLGLISDTEGNVVAFSGSSNETYHALRNNYETIDVYCSWGMDKERVEDKESAFQALWENEEPDMEVKTFSDAVKEKLLGYQTGVIDFEIDKKQFPLKKQKENNNTKEEILKEYQKEAIQAWSENSYVGIFDMATGTGKTFTALGGMCKLFRELDNRCIAFIVCPQVHLVEQWAEDLIDWGWKPIIAYSASAMKDWKERLEKEYKRMELRKRPLICITTNKTFIGETIQGFLQKIVTEKDCLLIIDEVHNFGAEKLSKYLNENIKYRLGLSATVERYMDDRGTNCLMQYFEKKCIEYPLEKAISDGALVEYYYYPVLVYLTEREQLEYQRLSKQLAKHITAEGNKVKLTETGEMILYKRARLVAGAENKLEKLREIIQEYKDDKYMLVYCGATKGVSKSMEDETDERQIDRVEKMLGNELGMVTHRFTSEENREERITIKQAFAEGKYQVLTAIKCLDEGVNIPEVDKAFILASSRNPREFIQRRGRLLRKSEHTGKTYSVIYDFVTLPRRLSDVHVSDYANDKALVQGELARIDEFGRYSLNSSNADHLIEVIQEAYGMDLIQIDEFYEDREE